MLQLLDLHFLPIPEQPLIVDFDRGAELLDDMTSLVPDGNSPRLEPAIGVVTGHDAVFDFQPTAVVGLVPPVACCMVVIWVE